MVNRMGDRTPPCQTPLVTEKQEKEWHSIALASFGSYTKKVESDSELEGCPSPSALKIKCRGWHDESLARIQEATKDWRTFVYKFGNNIFNKTNAESSRHSLLNAKLQIWSSEVMRSRQTQLTSHRPGNVRALAKYVTTGANSNLQ